MTYGITTYKSNGSTVVFQNSAKSGVFARTFTCIASNGTLVNNKYRKEFPEYAGRTMRVFDLKPGNAVWSYGTLSSGLNIIEYTVGGYGGLYTAIDPKFTVGDTVLYIFVR